MIKADIANRRNAPSKLSENWKWVHLGDVCEIVTGNTPPRENPSFYGGIVPWIKPDDLDKTLYVKTSAECLTEEGMKVARMLPEGAVLVSCIGKLGKVAIAACPLATNQQINALIPSAKIDSLYLYYACKFIRPKLEAVASLSLIAIVNKSVLSKVIIPLPPLAEQQRIVAILNKQMVAVQQAKDATEAQLEAAKKLPTLYLRSIFNGVEASNWPTKKLGQILKLRKEIIHPHNKPEGPATFVGLEHIESLTGKRFGALEVEMSKLTGRKPRFFAGNIVYGYLRPYLNKVWIAEFDGLCSVDQYVYSVDRKQASVEFVAWFMRSPVYLARAPIDTTPGQLPRIRTEEVAAVEINLPEIEEQNRVVHLIEARMSAIQRIHQSLETQLESINKLSAALLRYAFNGEL